MNAHLKTILAITLAILAVWFLVRHPNVATLLYRGVWVLIGLGVAANIYGIIYILFDRSSARENQDISHWEDPVC